MLLALFPVSKFCGFKLCRALTQRRAPEASVYVYIIYLSIKASLHIRKRAADRTMTIFWTTQYLCLHYRDGTQRDRFVMHGYWEINLTLAAP